MEINEIWTLFLKIIFLSQTNVWRMWLKFVFKSLSQFFVESHFSCSSICVSNRFTHVETQNILQIKWRGLYEDQFANFVSDFRLDLGQDFLLTIKLLYDIPGCILEVPVSRLPVSLSCWRTDSPQHSAATILFHCGDGSCRIIFLPHLFCQ